MTFTTDCLILCIDDSMSIKLFIFYDVKEKKFFIRGKNYEEEEKSDTNSEINTDSDTETYFLNKPFSFSSKKKKRIIEFFDYLISLNSCTFTLYNYDNLSNSSQDITYDFLEKFQDKRYEIVAYDRNNFDEKMCLNLLSILKNIYNDF